MSDRRTPKSASRRVERWLVGVVMAVIAFVLERMVLRSIKKGTTVPTRPDGTADQPIVRSKGTDVSG
jgi:hypothetical protein